MDKIIYCYIDIDRKKNQFHSRWEEFAYSKLQENSCYYDENVDEFFDKDGNLFSITGKRVLIRSQIREIVPTLEAIQRKGGIPINSKQDINRILNWQREIPINRSHLFVKGKEILENEEIKRKIVELSHDNQFFLKTIEKDFSDVISVEELFDPSKGFLSALELHRETEFIVSEVVDILTDQYGKVEYRCFVVDGKILNISRNLFCTYYATEPKVLEQANYILNRIKIISDFPTTFCMDIMIASYPNNPNIFVSDIVELNPLEATGEFLYNTVWENSICNQNNTITDELITQEDSLKMQMRDLVPIYKKEKKLGFTKGFEPTNLMKQCYYKDGFAYHYECAKKFGNPRMGRFWTHALFSSGDGKTIDIIDVLNDNISLKELLLLSREKLLRECGVDLEYMYQQIEIEEQKKIELSKPKLKTL